MPAPVIGSTAGMGVDAALALRVLAHELRSPAGVAQGYVRMLLDGRIAEPADQRRALEQVREVLGRIAELGRQASETASWLERAAEATSLRVDGREIVDAALGAVQQTQAGEVSNEVAHGAAIVVTIDRNALTTAIAAVVEATAREHLGQSTKITAKLTETRSEIEIVAGAPDALLALGAGPKGLAAGPISVERGGVGLSLVNAMIILDAHRAVAWTIDQQRGACGIRIPVEA